VPRLGDTPLQRLTTARVGALYGDLVASGGQDGRPLSAKTVRYVHTTLRRAHPDAVADGLVARNVAAQAGRRAPAGSGCAPGRPSRSARSSRRSGRTGCTSRGCCWPGSGCAEANSWACAGRTWTWPMAASRSATRGSWWPASPPWPSPRRPRAAAPSPWRQRCCRRCARTAPSRQPSGCPSAWGTPTRAWWSPPRTAGRWHPETLSVLFVRQANQAGLPPIRLHDLRHSIASILLAAGTHPKVVSELLGHSSIGLTLDTYSHVIPSLAEEAAGVVAAAVLHGAPTLPQPPPSGQVRIIGSGS
jgi:hypothetical protein